MQKSMAGLDCAIIEDELQAGGLWKHNVNFQPQMSRKFIFDQAAVLLRSVKTVVFNVRQSMLSSFCVGAS